MNVRPPHSEDLCGPVLSTLLLNSSAKDRKAGMIPVLSFLSIGQVQMTSSYLHVRNLDHNGGKKGLCGPINVVNYLLVLHE